MTTKSGSSLASNCIKSKAGSNAWSIFSCSKYKENNLVLINSPCASMSLLSASLNEIFCVIFKNSKCSVIISLAFALILSSFNKSIIKARYCFSKIAIFSAAICLLGEAKAVLISTKALVVPLNALKTTKVGSALRVIN